MQPINILQALILLVAANGTPVAATRILGKRCSYPLDGNLRFFDKRPLFGPSKTARGVVLAVPASALGAALLGLGWALGASVGGSAMLGDLFSSFVKRRLAMPASSRALFLDQIPESLIPLIACRGALSLGLGDILIAVAAFFVGEIVLSRLLFRWGLRDRPY